MYKVLIVDDEMLVRVGLKTTIDWEENGFTIVGEASNGEQGFEQYKRHMPDIIITDIRMPKQDGLWLIEEVRKRDQSTKILVLTCYDEFSYARKALKVGADDYILKSEVEDEELISALEALKKKIGSQNKKKDKSLISKDDVKKSIMSEIIKRNFNIEDKQLEKLSTINFPVSNTKFALVSFSISDNKGGEYLQSNSTNQVNQAILNIVSDKINEREIDFIYCSYNKRFIFLLSSKVLDLEEIKKMFTSVNNAVEQYFCMTLSIIYTDVLEHIKEIAKIYKSFIEKSEILFYKNEKSFFISNMNSINFKEHKFFC